MNCPVMRPPGGHQEAAGLRLVITLLLFFTLAPAAGTAKPMPSHIIVARSIAIGFFIVSLAILYASADHPPPPGFLLLVVLDLLVAGLVYWHVTSYLHWATNQRPGRWLRAAADGLVSGLTVATLLLLVHPNGEPGVRPDAIDQAILLAVLATVGLLASLLARSHHPGEAAIRRNLAAVTEQPYNSIRNYLILTPYPRGDG